ncbi:MAG: ester cyclase [Steroidobacteraceae bacterium]|nr:ester cyclase [Steroidobacteraceae bacterium]
MVDLILGMTHEVWEERRVDRLHDYLHPDCVIRSLAGTVEGVPTVVRDTWAMLGCFPDRLQLGDAVVWQRRGADSFHTSHRITSLMTHLGPGLYGPPTGRRVEVIAIADCDVEDGLIAREWLARDNFSLLRQLGQDPRLQARALAAGSADPRHQDWLAAEHARVRATADGSADAAVGWADEAPLEFAGAVLANAWRHGRSRTFASHYQPYAVLHESRPVASGRAEIERRCAAMRRTFRDVALSVDHVSVRSDGDDARQVAARWSLAARHDGEAWGIAPTGREVYLFGMTHWKLVAGRIAAEWSVFDRLGVLVQLFRPALR